MKIQKKECYTFEDFVKIIEALRAKDGCPWDREQTHNSLRPCIQEEAAELMAAIRIYEKTGNAENMQEELGDILLQVVMHSVIAKEEGIFSLEDVTDEICRKMIRRHPHVFGVEEIESAEQVLQNWEEIKKKEKEGKSWIESPLREVPMELPALARASKVIKKADKLYQTGKKKEQLLLELENSLRDLKKAVFENKAKKVEVPLTDMLWELSDLARQYGISQEQALADKIETYIAQCEPESRDK